MKQKVILGGLVGGVVILVFAFFIVFLLNSFFPEFYSGGSNGLIGLTPVILAPMAGGFLAGLISRENPKAAGWFAGIMAGVVLLICWVVLMGVSFQMVFKGLVIALVVAVLARTFSGFAQTHREA